MAWREKLRHAFAVDAPGPAEPNDAQRPVVDRLCKEVVRRHLTTPALIFLEMSRPLNYLSAQAMHFFQPIVEVLFDTVSYAHFAAFLEQRGSVEYICRRIEHFEQECGKREAAADSGKTGAKPHAPAGAKGENAHEP